MSFPFYRWANQGQRVGLWAQGWSRNAKGRSQACRLAGLDTGWHIHWLETSSQWAAQLCSPGSGPGAVPSPHHSSSKPPFSPGLLRKPFTSFDSPLIDVPSICHLCPPPPTLSRDRPEQLLILYTACLLQLPPGYSLPLPGLSPFPSLAGSRAQNRPGDKGKPQTSRPCRRGVLGESCRTWGVPGWREPVPRVALPSGSLCPLSIGVLWGFPSFCPGLSSSRMFSQILIGLWRASSLSRAVVASSGLCRSPIAHLPWWETHLDPVRRRWVIGIPTPPAAQHPQAWGESTASSAPA